MVTPKGSNSQESMLHRRLIDDGYGVLPPHGRVPTFLHALAERCDLCFLAKAYNRYTRRFLGPDTIHFDSTRHIKAAPRFPDVSS